MNNGLWIILNFLTWTLIFILINLKNNDSLYLKCGFVFQMCMCALISYILYVK